MAYSNSMNFKITNYLYPITAEKVYHLTKKNQIFSSKMDRNNKNKDEKKIVQMSKSTK